MDKDLLHLTWNNHDSTIIHNFQRLQTKETFCDATIVCDRKHFPVHRLILSSCSEFFEEVFEETPCKHPFIVLKDIKIETFKDLMEFMYRGEVNILQERVPIFISAADSLKIKGISNPDELKNTKSGNNSSSTSEKKRDLNSSSSQPAKKSKTSRQAHKELSVTEALNLYHETPVPVPVTSEEVHATSETCLIEGETATSIEEIEISNTKENACEESMIFKEENLTDESAETLHAPKVEEWEQEHETSYHYYSIPQELFSPTKPSQVPSSSDEVGGGGGTHHRRHIRATGAREQRAESGEHATEPGGDRTAWQGVEIEGVDEDEVLLRGDGRDQEEEEERAQLPVQIPSSAGFPRFYALPAFSKRVSAMLLVRDGACRKEIVKELFDQLSNYTWFPDKHHYSIVCLKLIEAHPFLADVDGNGFDTWKQSLRRKFKHERTKYPKVWKKIEQQARLGQQMFRT